MHAALHVSGDIKQARVIHVVKSGGHNNDRTAVLHATGDVSVWRLAVGHMTHAAVGGDLMVGNGGLAVHARAQLNVEGKLVAECGSSDNYGKHPSESGGVNHAATFLPMSVTTVGKTALLLSSKWDCIMGRGGTMNQGGTIVPGTQLEVREKLVVERLRVDSEATVRVMEGAVDAGYLHLQPRGYVEAHNIVARGAVILEPSFRTNTTCEGAYGYTSTGYVYVEAGTYVAPPEGSASPPPVVHPVRVRRVPSRSEQ